MMHHKWIRLFFFISTAAVMLVVLEFVSHLLNIPHLRLERSSANELLLSLFPILMSFLFAGMIEYQVAKRKRIKQKR